MNPPNGCAACGVAQRAHPWIWHESVGAHQWIAPSNAQRLARMKHNRNRRIFGF